MLERRFAASGRRPTSDGPWGGRNLSIRDIPTINRTADAVLTGAAVSPLIVAGGVVASPYLASVGSTGIRVLGTGGRHVSQKAASYFEVYAKEKLIVVYEAYDYMAGGIKGYYTGEFPSPVPAFHGEFMEMVGASPTGALGQFQGALWHHGQRLIQGEN